MRLPPNDSRITLRPRAYDSPFPPLGFLPFEREDVDDHADPFGLYWPIGREGDEPLVVRWLHERYGLLPLFSSLGRFLDAPSAGDEEEDDEDDDDDEGGDGGDDVPSLDADPGSPLALLVDATESLQAGAPDRALASLAAAVARLPEYGEASALVSAQYRRVGDSPRAAAAAIQALISPPCLGGADPDVRRWLARQQQAAESLEHDPIWKARTRLTFDFGGATSNDDYPILLDAIHAYVDAGDGIRACTLMQCYGELMERETVSFQERYGYHTTDFVAWQLSVARGFGLERDAAAATS